MTPGQQLRNFRELNKMSQRDLANVIGKSQAWVAAAENDYDTVSKDKVAELVNTFDSGGEDGNDLILGLALGFIVTFLFLFF